MRSPPLSSLLGGLARQEHTSAAPSSHIVVNAKVSPVSSVVFPLHCSSTDMFVHERPNLLTYRRVCDSVLLQQSFVYFEAWVIRFPAALGSVHLRPLASPGPKARLLRRPDLQI